MRGALRFYAGLGGLLQGHCKGCDKGSRRVTRTTVLSGFYK